MRSASTCSSSSVPRSSGWQAIRAQRVVILRGAGPVFSAGLDLREAADSSLVERSAAAVSRALNLLRTSPLVMIAAVQGGAFAGGAGLMAACDIVIAAADAKIGFPEARRGLLPALICDVLIAQGPRRRSPRAVPRRRADRRDSRATGRSRAARGAGRTIA